MRTGQAVARAARSLGSSAEARSLLAHVLGVEPARLLLLPEVSDAEVEALDALIERRLEGVPVQHITGRAFFRTIEVEVGPGVFVPRPETELLVGWALDRLAQLPDATGAVVVELCAGSGAISLALATECPGPAYHAVELSRAAWAYLTRNLAGSGVHVERGDMADAFHELDGLVDLVIVNPPYVPATAREELPRDVLHDPEPALFAGADGLDALRVVARVALRLLRPGGWLCAEHDDSQGESAPALLRDVGGFGRIRDVGDLNDRPRFVTAQREPGATLAGWTA